MTISNFASLLELAAGLNVVYIAGDYSTLGYTSILSNKLFEFPEKIRLSFKRSVEIICEKKSLESLRDLEINGKSIAINIEESVREFERLDTELKEAQTNLETDIHKDCESKSFSSLSLCMFLFCTISLYIGGFENSLQDSGIFSKFLILFVGLMLLPYIIIGWFKNKKTRFWKLDYAKLSHSLLYFVIILIISFGLSFASYYYYGNIDVINSIVNWSIQIFVIFPFLNFIVYVLIIRNKGKNIAKKINTKAREIENRCRQTKDKADTLITTYNFVSTLGVEQKIIT